MKSCAWYGEGRSKGNLASAFKDGLFQQGEDGVSQQRYYRVTDANTEARMKLRADKRATRLSFWIKGG